MQLQRWTSSMAFAAALALGFGAVAHAQPHGGPHRHGPAPHAKGPHQAGPQGPHHSRPSLHHGPRPAPGPVWHHGHRPPPPPMVRHYRGAGPHHAWVQGSRLPPQYRSARYVVHDWRGHRLHPPPRGYHWVQYGSDYMLVAIASGVITQLLIDGLR